MGRYSRGGLVHHMTPLPLTDKMKAVKSEQLAIFNCEWCGKEFERPNPRGRLPRFCSPTHRQRAHEQRRLFDVVDFWKSLVRDLSATAHMGYKGDSGHISSTFCMWCDRCPVDLLGSHTDDCPYSRAIDALKEDND